VSGRDVIRAFDAGAESFDAAYETRGPCGEWLRERFAVAIRLLGENGGEVLDAGTGTGRLVEELERRGWTAWGVDASPRMLALARARTPQAADRLVEAQIEQLPFADERFDAVVSLGVLNYVDDLGVAMGELARVLRPGGRLLFSMGNGCSPLRVWEERVTYPTARILRRCVRFRRPPPAHRRPSPTRARLAAVLDSLGLELVEVEYVGPTLLPAPLDSLFPRAAVRLSRAAGHLGAGLRRILSPRMVAVARKSGRAGSAGLERPQHGLAELARRRRAAEVGRRRVD
jgi:ubiquinone/menaquinone biosynthesis C-methylase UbiE